MKVLAVLLSLAAYAGAYRLNNYYGTNTVDGLASSQHMPLQYQEGLMVEADTGANDHRNFGSYYYSRDGAGLRATTRKPHP